MKAFDVRSAEWEQTQAASTGTGAALDDPSKLKPQAWGSGRANGEAPSDTGCVT